MHSDNSQFLLMNLFFLLIVLQLLLIVRVLYRKRKSRLVLIQGVLLIFEVIFLCAFPFWNKSPLWLIYGLMTALLGNAVVGLGLEFRFSGAMITQNSIKEGIDSLPMAVAFFDSNGLPVMTNHSMEHIFYEMSGSDLQHILEYDEKTAAYSDLISNKGNEIIVSFNDRSVWRFMKKSNPDDAENWHTRISGTDITDLYELEKKLTKENESLRQYGEKIHAYAENVTATAHEEEVLNARIQVHDMMGRNLTAIKNILRNEMSMDQADEVIDLWKKDINLMEYEMEEEKDPLTEIIQVAGLLGLDIVMKGNLPEDKRDAYLIISAIRECTTNAIRHGRASEMFVSITQDGPAFHTVITNNGKAPAGDITEGGGLSTLRRRIELAGGTMEIQSLPAFSLSLMILSYTA